MSHLAKLDIESFTVLVGIRIGSSIPKKDVALSLFVYLKSFLGKDVSNTVN